MPSAVYSLLPLVAGAALAVAGQPARTITFKNSCAKDVWFYETAGSTGQCSAGCEDGSTCDQTNGVCYWNKPTPSGGNYRVPAGKENSVTYPAYNNNDGAAWSGNFIACMDGTPCLADGKVTDSGTCDSQGCGSLHVGSAAEFTLLKKGTDYYDISNIGGVAVPMSISPESENPNAADPYFCASLGAATSTTGLGATTWKFDPPSPIYNWVLPASGAASCKSDADCNGSTCGLALDQNDQVTFSQVCGTRAGYWTQNAICSANPGTSVTNCGASISNGPYNTDQWHLQGCTGDAVSGSCYTQSPAADEHCCGCVNWQDTLANNLVPSTGTKQCVNSNPIWTSDILPTLQWLKEGAPNAYTYPYDDISSTSTCSLMSGDYNSMNYVIEFCPGGVYWD